MKFEQQERKRYTVRTNFISTLWNIGNNQILNGRPDYFPKLELSFL